MKKDNGGPAFPCELWEDGDLAKIEGMSLRDYFAAKAMSVFAKNTDCHSSVLALKAYEVADAMLKAREE